MADTAVLPIQPVKSARILLVDNDVSVLGLIETVLCRTKFVVTRESDVCAAFEAATTNSGSDWPVQMVLVSFDSREIHGFRLASRLRAEGVVFPIVAVSATMSRLRCCTSGATHFLRKPIDCADLLALVNEQTIETIEQY